MTTEEIKELLATELLRKGVAKKYVVVSDDCSSISYNCKNKTKRRLQNPEEFVQAAADQLFSIQLKGRQNDLLFH